MLFVAVEKIAAFISWGIQKMMLLRRGTGGQTMAEYIEREALLVSLCQGNYPWTDFNDAIEIVENQQAADVSAVVPWTVDRPGGPHVCIRKNAGYKDVFRVPYVCCTRRF